MKKKNVIKNKDFDESLTGWANEMSDFIRPENWKGKGLFTEPGETIFGFVSEGDDPNGMHEFRYNSKTVKAPKCICCGKTQDEI